MRTGTEYLPKDSVFPLSGLNTLQPSSQADPTSSPDCLNVAIQKGIVSKRKGYTFLGGTLNASGAAEPVLALYEFEDLTSIKTLVAFTTKKQYKWDGAAWQNITGAGPNDTTWTGAETDTVEVAVIAGKDGGGTYSKWIVATNGKDATCYWDGVAGTFKPYVPTGITDFKTCRTIRSFYNHVLLGNITYTTGNKDQTIIAWSDAGDLLDFATGAGQTSGIEILTDVDGTIQQFEQLADRLQVYGDNTVHALTYVGAGPIFTVERILNETRLVSRRAIVNIGLFHLFLSQENIVLFDGTRLTRHIGDRIYRSYRDEFLATNKYMAFAFHDPAKRQAYFCYPLNGGESQFYTVEYDTNDANAGLWTRIKYLHRSTCMGFYSRDSNLAYNSSQLIGVKYSGTDFPYNQGSIKGSFPVRIFGTVSGRVALSDDTVPNDAGGVFTSYWDSVDFTVPQGFLSQFGRWIEVELDMKGWEAELWISTDLGDTYNMVQQLNLTSGWRKQRVPLDIMSPTLRIRIKNTCPNSSFYLRWMRVFVRPGGPA